MMNSTLEILHNLKENQANSITLLNRRFSGYQLKVSREENGRLRGWVTTMETREVKLKGLPTYLTRQCAIQLLKQSYFKFQKEAIEVLPRGLGGMKREHVDSSSILKSGKTETLEQETLQKLKSSVSDIDSLVEAISDKRESALIRETVKMLLEKDPKETALGLQYEQIGTLGIQALGAALQVNHTLQFLDLGYNQIDDAGARAIGVVLQVNQSIQELNIEYNQIGEKGAQALGTALQTNHTLQSLNLEENKIGDAGAQALGTALQVNQSLQSLNLEDNKIGDAGAQALGSALQVNQSLQSLNLQYNQIGTTGAQVLATGLQVNYTLQILNLTKNQINDASTQALGAALQVNHTLQSLDLATNKIGDAGAQTIGTALQTNQTLQSLNLEENEISDAGVQALATALQVNQSMQTLNLAWNQIDDVGAQALATALQVNQSLQSLDLFYNKIGDDGAQALGAGLQVNQSIQSLDLNRNQIGNTGAQALGAALQVNQSLQSLNFSFNEIGDVGAQALEVVLQVNQTLQLLDLGWNTINDTEITRSINLLLRKNQEIATVFQQQITQVQNFLRSHENDEGILLEHLPQLKELLSKWHTDSKNIIFSLQDILQQSWKTNLNDRYREKLAETVKDLTNRLHNLWLESFEKKVVTLSNKYVMGKELSKERNVDLGYALYEMWLTFLGSECPNWVEDRLQSLIPFGALLDIAEGGEKQNVSELKDPHFLFQRVLSFRNESKDSLFSLTNQSKKS